MKKSIALIFILVLFFGCIKNENNDFSKEIFGLWQLEKYESMTAGGYFTLTHADDEQFNGKMVIKMNGQIVYQPNGPSEQSNSTYSISSYSETDTSLYFKLNFKIFDNPVEWVCIYHKKSELLQVNNIQRTWYSKK